MTGFRQLWAELRGTGVDVLACVAGAVATPGLGATMRRPAPGTVHPDRSPKRPCTRSAAARGPCPAT